MAASPTMLWRWAAQAVRGWLAQRQLPPADAVVLLPFAELIVPARRALAESGNWLPRVHTTRTLAAALGPPPLGAGEVSGDGAVDRASARELLRGHDWAAAWLQRDPRAFDGAIDRLVHTAHALRAKAMALPPHERAAWWQRARQQLPGGGGVGATHRLLLRVAVEWCALSDHAHSDRLFDHRPAAWIVVTLGGEDELALNVSREGAAHGVPSLHLCADPPAADPFDDWPEQCALELEVAADAEEEALATARQVVQQVCAGATPVALVAQDRALVRRVRALLERQHIDLADETGWSLATTRAGARASAALRAANAAGANDDVLDWLKADFADSAAAELTTLEKLWRGARVQHAALRTRAEALWRRERARLDAFARPHTRPFERWLRAFDQLLFAAAAASPWHDDAAAVQLRRALRLREQDRDAVAAHGAAAWRLEEFAAWVDAALAEAVYVPPASAQTASVVITPLARAIGRDFAAAVLPGADEQRLGSLPPESGLLDEPLRRMLGLPERAARQRRHALSFVQLLRLPRVLVVRRRADGDELLAASPWLQRLRLARRERGAAVFVERDTRLPQRSVATAPVPRPAPQAAGALPASLSASALEALRQCPYRFFSRTVLHLSEQAELDDEVDKRDAGKWLHATLEHFHLARPERREPDDDVRHFVAAADEALSALVREEGVSVEAMLPFSAGLPALAERYVRWLRSQEAQGWRFDGAEQSLAATPTGETGLALHGRIDRIDLRSDTPAVRLIDYKTSSRKALEDKVRATLEDTQLAVYAALQLAQPPPARPVQACYLALDEPDEVVAVEHPDVERSARVLVEHVSAERARIEAGAALPALGESPVCDTCEARGLCRRDHWGDLGEEDFDGA
ncbi:MAG TPA: PD-(D/E)XK nuclease family protein [Burkholderiaceae bacterium]|nr:PD-(D/E)XK nuclease family protein [Burkholderiaceae bacterium]